MVRAVHYVSFATSDLENAMMFAAVENGVFFSLYGVLILGLLGVYGLGFKIMKDVNSKIDKHVTDTSVHVDVEHPIVTAAVCEQVQLRNELHFENLAKGQERIEKAIEKLGAKS